MVIDTVHLSKFYIDKSLDYFLFGTSFVCKVARSKAFLLLAGR